MLVGVWKARTRAVEILEMLLRMERAYFERNNGHIKYSSQTDIDGISMTIPQPCIEEYDGKSWIALVQ